MIADHSEPLLPEFTGRVEVHYEVPAWGGQPPWRTITGRVHVTKDVIERSGLVPVERDVPTPKGTRTTEIPRRRIIHVDHLPEETT